MDRQWQILIAVMAITLLFPTNNIQQKKRCVMLAATALILFSGLRSWWYGDLTKYYHGYLDASGMSIKEIYEAQGLRNIGISVCFKIMSSLFGQYGYDYFIFVVAFFSVFTLSKVIMKYSPSPFLSYMLFICMGLFSFTYSGLKQTIAMGFCCLAIIELLEGTFIRFTFFTILGALFHAPALLFFLAWPLSRKKIDALYYVVILGLIAAVFLFRNQLVGMMESAYYAANVAEDAADIVASEEAVGGRFIMMIVILVGATFIRPPSRTDVVFSRIYGVIILAAVFQMFSIYDNNYTRLADYFFQFITIFTPLLLEQYEYDPNGQRRQYAMFTNKKEIYVFARIVVVVFSLWFYSKQIEGMQTYYFFWEFDAHHWYGA